MNEPKIPDLLFREPQRPPQKCLYLPPNRLFIGSTGAIIGATVKETEKILTEKIGIHRVLASIKGILLCYARMQKNS